MKNDYESLSHTKWRCQYHIVLVPKYRRQIIYGKYKAEIGKIIRTICDRYEVNIVNSDCHLFFYSQIARFPHSMEIMLLVRDFPYIPNIHTGILQRR